MKRGTIVLTRFPFTDLSSNKRRPAIIVSPDRKSSVDVIVAFITSVVPDKFSDTDLLIDAKHPDYKKSGLLKNSIIKLDKLATLNQNIFSGELGSVSDTRLLVVNKKLKTALGLK